MKRATPRTLPPSPWDDIFKNKKWGTYPSEAVVREVMGLISTKGYALDLGCGAGGNTVFLAENGYKVRAVDSSREALHQAEKLCIRKGVDDCVVFNEWDYINDETGAPAVPGVGVLYDIVLDWLSLAHQPKNKIVQVMERYRAVVSEGGAYIVGLFGSESKKESFIGVPMPSLFTGEEVSALLDDVHRRYAYPVVESKIEEISYTRNGLRVQVWCLVFTRQ